jgi:hypothetical protein
MQFATILITLAIAAVNGVVASPACAAAASQPFPRSLSNLSPEQEVEVYKQIRSTWSNRTLEMEAELFAQRSSKALGKRCDSCSGNVGFAACVSSESGLDDMRRNTFAES